MGALGLILSAGIGLRLAVAALFHGSNDVSAMAIEGETILAGLPVYSWTAGNKLPLAYFVSALAVGLSRLSGLPPSFAVKLPAIAADLLAAGVLYRLGRGGQGWRSPRGLLALYLLNPATIMLSAYHGNLDPLMAALMVTMVLAWSRGHPILGGVLLGAAIAIKTPAALALPVALAHADRMERARLAVAALAVPIGLALPFALADPGFTKVFTYASLYGNWGIPLMLGQGENILKYTVGAQFPLVAALASVNRLARMMGRYMLLAILVGWLIHVTRRRPDGGIAAVVRDLAATFMVFYVFASGFGVQYLSWAVPFVILASPALGIVYVAGVTPFLLGTYLQAGLPHRYGVQSVTQNLRLLSSADFALLVANGLAGLAAWATCAWILYRLCGSAASDRAPMAHRPGLPG